MGLRNAARATDEPVLTLRAWGDLPEDEPGELVDGRLEEEERPTVTHELVVLWLGALLRAWLARRGGLVLGSETKLAVRARRGRKPDLSVYLPGVARPAASASLIDVPPTIVVEVASPRPRDIRRDRIEKLDDYAAFGVPFYWLLDPAVRTLEIYELTRDGRYTRSLSAAAGRIRSVPGCTGLAVDLDALWAEIDAIDRPASARAPRRRARAR
ncbi:MAG: Uma2 family endonuclease [bacterium]